MKAKLKGLSNCSYMLISLYEYIITRLRRGGHKFRKKSWDMGKVRVMSRGEKFCVIIF